MFFFYKYTTSNRTVQISVVLIVHKEHELFDDLMISLWTSQQLSANFEGGLQFDRPTFICKEKLFHMSRMFQHKTPIKHQYI